MGRMFCMEGNTLGFSFSLSFSVLIVTEFGTGAMLLASASLFIDGDWTKFELFLFCFSGGSLPFALLSGIATLLEPFLSPQFLETLFIFFSCANVT